MRVPAHLWITRWNILCYHSHFANRQTLTPSLIRWWDPKVSGGGEKDREIRDPIFRLLHRQSEGVFVFFLNFIAVTSKILLFRVLNKV